MIEILLESFYIFLIICVLTLWQKYYFKNIYYIEYRLKKLWFIIKVFLRIWVIIHEFCHLFFGILAWNKPVKIDLFSKNWWKVSFQTKDYIWSLPNYWFSAGYFFRLILNQVGIFLTSIWPLFVWIVLNFFLINYLEIDIFNLKNFEINYINFIIIVLYSIFLPSFILSYQDIKNFIISKQSNIFATILASLINTSIFVAFLWAMTFLFEWFILFAVLFFIYFFIIFFLRIILSFFR